MKLLRREQVIEREVEESEHMFTIDLATGVMNRIRDRESQWEWCVKRIVTNLRERDYHFKRRYEGDLGIKFKSDHHLWDLNRRNEETTGVRD